MLFSLISFETQTCTIICEFICNIIFRCNPAYVMCICLIIRSWLWCWFTEVFRILGGLPSLYKWKYARVNVLAGQPYLILYKLDGCVTKYKYIQTSQLQCVNQLAAALGDNVFWPCIPNIKMSARQVPLWTKNRDRKHKQCQLSLLTTG